MIYYYSDSYEYDIEKCHYMILEKINPKLVSWINCNNKTSRNISIGKIFKNNAELCKITRKIVTSIIDKLISDNNLKSNDIIIRQYDGIITKKKLNNIPSYIVLKKHFTSLLLSYYSQSMYIARYNEGIDIKGIPDRYSEIDKLLKKLILCNFSSKSSIFSQIEYIKRIILDSSNIRIFIKNEANNKYSVFLKKYGKVIISESTFSLLDCNEIDKNYYIEKYFDQFFKSIVISFT